MGVALNCLLYNLISNIEFSFVQLSIFNGCDCCGFKDFKGKGGGGELSLSGADGSAADS